MKLEEFQRLLRNGVGKVEVRDIRESAPDDLTGGSDDHLEEGAKKALMQRAALEELRRKEKAKKVGPKFTVNLVGDDAILHFGKYNGRELSSIRQEDPLYLSWLIETFSKTKDLKCKEFVEIVKFVKRQRART